MPQKSLLSPLGRGLSVEPPSAPTDPGSVSYLHVVSSLLKRSNMRHQRLHLVIAQFVPIRLHFLLPVLFDSLLDRFDGILIFHLRLHLRIGVILHPSLGPHLGLSL